MEKERIKVDDLTTSVRLFNILHNMNIEYLDQLEPMSAVELAQRRAIGKSSVREIRAILTKHGLCLRGDMLLTKEEEKTLVCGISDHIKRIEFDLNRMAMEIKELSLKLDHLHFKFTTKMES